MRHGLDLNSILFHQNLVLRKRQKTAKMQKENKFNLTLKSFPWVNDSILVSVEKLNVFLKNILIVWYWFLINCTLNSSIIS